MRRWATYLLGLVVLTAGCGQLPRPFQPEDKSANALLELRDGASILVLPVAHDAPGAPDAAAEALASALRTNNVPASTRRSNGASRILTGRAVLQDLPDGKDELLLFWEILDAKGSRLGHVTQRSELAPGAWRAGDPDSVATVMDQAALRIATVVRGPRDEPDEPQDDAGARLAIAPMAGLPGDGARSLPAALRLRLVAAGVAVAEQPNEGDIVVNCQVTLRPLGLLQEATVVWVVSRNGAELGRITQQSHVPAGSLDGPWGTTATGIAEGATIGIIELFERRAETI